MSRPSQIQSGRIAQTADGGHDELRAARQRTAVSPPDRTLLLLLALYACWGSAIPAMKLMVDTVPPLGGAALVFLVAGLVLAVAARGRPAPARVQLRRLAVEACCCWWVGKGSRWWR